MASPGGSPLSAAAGGAASNQFNLIQFRSLPLSMKTFSTLVVLCLLLVPVFGATDEGALSLCLH